MRVAALISFLFGLLGLMLLDGQVFTHAVLGIICGGVTIGCGLASAAKDRLSKARLWVGRGLAGLGVLLVALSIAQLPGAYEFQTRFNERSRGHRGEQPSLANPAAAVDAPIPFRLSMVHDWRRATAQRRWVQTACTVKR